MIPALTTAAQPSAGDVAKLVDTISATGVKTIFAESSVNPKVEEAIAREAGARIGTRAVGRLARPEGLATARPTSARSRPTRARWSRASPAVRSTAASMPDLAAPYIQRGIVEILLLAVIAGVLGTWVVLRRLPFYTHAIGTATFPGLVVAGPWGVPAQLTALVCAVGFGGVLERVQRTRRIDPDAAIGLLLVAALAIGVVLASDVYHSGAGVDRLLFGSLIALTPLDLWLTAAAAVGALACDAALRRSWLATGFDADGARAGGVRTAAADRALLLAVAVAVVVALDAVGALLVTVVLTVPAATVRLFEPVAAHPAAGDVRARPRSRAWPRSGSPTRFNVGPGPALAVLGALVYGLRAGGSCQAAAPLEGSVGGRPSSASYDSRSARRVRARRRRARRRGLRGRARARSSRCSGPTAAARRRCSARCWASCRTGRARSTLAGRPAYVPQTERARLDFPVSAHDVALMGAYGRTPWFRRVAREDRARADAALDARRARRPRARRASARSPAASASGC